MLKMVTGVNSILSGKGSSASGVNMTAAKSPTTGSVNGDAHQLNGINIIEPAKRTGDNRRVS